MRIGIAALILAYILSQFYRAFLAVLSPVLTRDLGVTAAELASASGWWFLAFAAMQIPIGAWLDRVGPRLTSGLLMAVGAGGAVLFSQATGAGQIKIAMALIGVGCAPVLMASYFIFARQFAPSAFGTLAALTLAVGTLGNVASSLPLSWAVAAFGWRETVLGLAAVTGAVALAILVLVRDPERLAGARDGSLVELLRMPLLWPVLIMMTVCYAPIAGLRGLWIGPYFADVHGADQLEIGRISLWMGLAMVVGNFAYGPLDRWFPSRKLLVLLGNAAMLVCLFGLWWFAAAPPMVAVVLLVAAGFFGASFPIVLAHGRAFVPAHLTGRGVTLLNLFGIAPIGIAQIVTGRIHAATEPVTPAAPYAAVFLFFALATAIGLAVYLLSRDRAD
ncbi:MFS transporter [Tabrizicola flagellatus]|uniref:MFS transporter n=1 Tax=Tabrizicola flagellatus TaxID=2593021 RepID=UPI0011F30B50|nr:MFS transporter [Tabrizicola flagellatus]